MQYCKSSDTVSLSTQIGESTVKPMCINWKISAIPFALQLLYIVLWSHQILEGSEALFFLHSIPKVTGIAWTLDANINGNSRVIFQLHF